MGAVILLRTARASQQRTLRRRAVKTVGLTREIAARTAFRSDSDELGPVRKRFIAKSDMGKRNRSGASRDAATRLKPVNGLDAKPAHRIRPLRLAGFVAAN